jgi:hypothetical protein
LIPVTAANTGDLRMAGEAGSIVFSFGIEFCF